MIKVIEPDQIPPELKDRINNVKRRILFLSPSVASGEEREAKKEDFESTSNANIGIGGFGKVYKVRHKVSKNVYAVKVVNKNKIIENSLIEQMKLEVRIMYSVDHKNIIKLYNHYEDDDNFYLVMELAPKSQLYSKLKLQGRFDEKFVGKVMAQMISAIEYLHSFKPPIIHRDIKPENILLDADENCKLSDFGWSNFSADADIKRNTYCGTPDYLAPEMIEHKGHDTTLDIWSLGVLLFELLAGKPPFDGSKGQKELFANIKNNKINYLKDFSSTAKDLVSKILKLDPKQRLSLKEIKSHPWIKSFAPMLDQGEIEGKTLPNLKEKIALEEYQVVSRTSSITKHANEQAKKKVSIPQIPIVSQMNYNKENKFSDYLKEIDSLKKEKTEHQQQIKSLSETIELLKAKSVNSESDLNSNAMKEELLKLRLLNKNRDQLKDELEEKTKKITILENDKKILQNELDNLTQNYSNLNSKYKGLTNIKEEHEKEIDQYVQKMNSMEKEKNQKILELEATLTQVQTSMISKSESLVEDGNEKAFDNGVEICKQYLSSISKSLKQYNDNYSREEKLMMDLVKMTNQLNEYKTKYDNMIFELTQSNITKMEEKEKLHDAEIMALQKQYEKLAYEFGKKSD